MGEYSSPQTCCINCHSCEECKNFTFCNILPRKHSNRLKDVRLFFKLKFSGVLKCICGVKFKNICSLKGLKNAFLLTFTLQPTPVTSGLRFHFSAPYSLDSVHTVYSFIQISDDFLQMHSKQIQLCGEFTTFNHRDRSEPPHSRSTAWPTPRAGARLWIWRCAWPIDCSTQDTR